jgi:UDP-glucose 4-epimerase
VDYRGKTVLVTGAGGFLGSRLVQRLADTARDVYGIARPFTRSESRENIHFPCVDLRNEVDTVRWFESVRPDVIFHMASASGGVIGVDNLLPHLWDDIVTTVNCLVAAQKTGVSRFIIPGSTDEPQSAVPDSPYAMAKMTCVACGRMFHHLYAVPVVVCRIFMTYGPAQKERKVLPYIIRSMLASVPPKLASRSRLVDWIYIDDTIEALMLAGVQPDVEGRTFEIGSGELVSIGEIAARVQRLITGARPASASDDPFYRSSRRADLTEAREFLGWSPHVSLEDGLMATIEWYRRNRDGTADDSGEYPRVNEQFLAAKQQEIARL